MIIPKKYKLTGDTINVEIVKDFANAGKLGRFFLDRNLIILQAPCEIVDSQCVESTFWHELVHSILLKLCYTDLSNDEDFVDRFSMLLKQSINTMEFDND